MVRMDARIPNFIEGVLQDLPEKKSSHVEEAKRKYCLNLGVRPILHIHIFDGIQW
jgi:hypothetical protein